MKLDDREWRKHLFRSGQDKYTGQMFGNRDFLINCLNYLVDDHGINGTEIKGAKAKAAQQSKDKIRKD